MFRRLREGITPTDVIMWLIGGAILIAILIGSTVTLTKGPYTARHWFDFIVFGLAQGSIYALIAMGYTMVYGTLRMINFAHSEVFMSGPYTAYFFAPEENRWMLIASFKRPMTNTYLKRFHSFLENFIPTTGDQSRMALYGNPWVMDANGKWTAIASAKFTADQTARKRFRLDYAGGTMAKNFYLKNCGFFVPSTPIDSQFSIEAPSTAPVIDFTKLQ